VKRVVVVVALAFIACHRAVAVDEAGIAERLASSTPPPKGQVSPIGTNLAPIDDWSTEQPFADLMKQSRDWISNTDAQWDDGRKIDVDAHGWPKSLKYGQRARTLLIWGDAKPSGDYVATWAGSGEIDFWPQHADVTDHRAVIHGDERVGGLALTIVKTDEKNPIRDIHVFRSDEVGAQFSAKFVASLKNYSTLRFMDWMQTNDAHVEKFADRAHVDDARFTDRGVPLEVMIDLCNAAHADMWLTVPDTWDEDALHSASTLVHDKLAKDLVLYVESSNEVWNALFPQAKRAQQYGVAHALAKDPFEAQLRRHAQRSVEVFRWFTAAFAGERGRLVRVMGGFVESPWASEIALSSPDAAKNTDALAIAPYVGNTVKEGSSVDSVMARLDKHLAVVLDNVKKQHEVADKFKVKLIAYEGGQHLIGPDDDEAKIYVAANRDARIKDLYARLLRGWREAGGGLFVHYFDVGAPQKSGTWGAREDLATAREHAPKYDALMAFAEANPRWW
jgi:hypothetical protein